MAKCNQLTHLPFKGLKLFLLQRRSEVSSWETTVG